MNRCQAIFGSKNVEVTLSNPNDEVLLRRFPDSFGFGDLFICALQVDNLVPAENGLALGDVPVGIVALSIEAVSGTNLGRKLSSVGFGLTPASTGRNLWQEYAARLWFGLQSSETTCLGLVNLWVALQRLLIYLEQRGGIGGCWQDRKADNYC